MGEHTKGPWEAALHADPQWGVRVSGSEFHFIALTTQGNDEANARLIAAAPALLAALEQIANADSNQSPLNVTACYEAMKAIAQAALSAASGRAPTNKEE